MSLVRVGKLQQEEEGKEGGGRGTGALEQWPLRPSGSSEGSLQLTEGNQYLVGTAGTVPEGPCSETLNKAHLSNVARGGRGCHRPRGGEFGNIFQN